MSKIRIINVPLFVLLSCLMSGALYSSGLFAANDNKVSLSFQDIEIREVMQMLSRQERVNILVSEGVSGRISVNLYDVKLDEAIHSIAMSAGFAVERRKGSYFILERENAGKYALGGLTKLRTFKVQYSDPSVVESILKKHLSSFGKITTMTDRKLLVIEDQPEFIHRIAVLLKEIDRKPKQILIEAKIFEVTLKDGESFGLDWKKLFTLNGNKRGSNFGVQGLASPNSSGLFFNVVAPNVEVVLNALKTRGRLRTLSTPKLLAMENQESSTVIGDRIGFKVTTTINQVTTESIEFLESGVILKVTPSVDEDGQILLDIHPEVSTGTVSDDGIPSKTTTQVSTQMLVPNGQSVFIGGLIKHSIDESKESVPLLGDIPGLGMLFSNSSRSSVSTETVVLIKPTIIEHTNTWNEEQVKDAAYIESELSKEPYQIDRRMDQLMYRQERKPQRVPADESRQYNWLRLDTSTPEPDVIPRHVPDSGAVDLMPNERVKQPAPVQSESHDWWENESG